MEGFTRAFAREMADFNVNVNCIAPGPIATDLLKGITPVQIGRIVAQQVIPKQFSADAVCDLVEILLDDRAKVVSGQGLSCGRCVMRLLEQLDGMWKGVDRPFLIDRERNSDSPNSLHRIRLICRRFIKET